MTPADLTTISSIIEAAVERGIARGLQRNESREDARYLVANFSPQERAALGRAQRNAERKSRRR